MATRCEYPSNKPLLTLTCVILGIHVLLNLDLPSKLKSYHRGGLGVPASRIHSAVYISRKSQSPKAAETSSHLEVYQDGTSTYYPPSVVANVMDSCPQPQAGPLHRSRSDYSTMGRPHYGPVVKNAAIKRTLDTLIARYRPVRSYVAASISRLIGSCTTPSYARTQPPRRSPINCCGIAQFQILADITLGNTVWPSNSLTRRFAFRVPP
jgi:hypothetical protein